MSDITTYTDQPQEDMSITVNKDRSISVPEILRKSIVQYDHNIEKITFNCPRYWYGNDISTMAIYVNYETENAKASDKKPLRDVCSNVEIDEDNPEMLHFVWTITHDASQYMGKLAWKVCAIATDDDGIEIMHWNSHTCHDMEVQEGLEAVDHVPDQYPDEYSHLVQRVNAIEKENENQSKSIEKQSRNLYNAQQYNVLPSNTGEQNSTALQNLIDMINESGGGIIYIPHGIYVFSPNGQNTMGERCVKMKSNVSIIGDGLSTILKPTGHTSDGLDMFYFNDYVDTGNAVYLENCIFEDFVIDGIDTTCDNYTSAGKGFMINVFRNCHWRNIVVRNTDATGIGVDCPVDSSIVDCIAEGCGKAAKTSNHGASGIGIGYGYSEDENMYISRCRTSRNKRFGIFFEHQRRFKTNSSKYTKNINRGFIISECTSSENNHNFGAIQGINVQYKNCFSQSAINHGYYFENSENSHAVGCYSVNESGASFVIVESSVDGGTQEVKDISFNQCISKYSEYGCKVVNTGSNAIMQRNLIKDCYFDSEKQKNIATSGTMAGLIIMGNVATGGSNDFSATVTNFINKNNSWN